MLDLLERMDAHSRVAKEELDACERLLDDAGMPATIQRSWVAVYRDSEGEPRPFMSVAAADAIAAGTEILQDWLAWVECDTDCVDPPGSRTRERYAAWVEQGRQVWSVQEYAKQLRGRGRSAEALPLLDAARHLAESQLSACAAAAECSAGLPAHAARHQAQVARMQAACAYLNTLTTELHLLREAMAEGKSPVLPPVMGRRQHRRSDW